jgi:hypothetical protein
MPCPLCSSESCHCELLPPYVDAVQSYAPDPRIYLVSLNRAHIDQTACCWHSPASERSETELSKTWC